MTRPPSVAVSSSHRLSVFDFSEEDDKVDNDVNMLGRYQNPKRKRDLLSSPITKYTFLQQFAGCTKLQEKESVNEPIIIDDEPTDVDARQGIKTHYEELSDDIVETKTKTVRLNDEVSIPSPICLLNEGGFVTEKCHLDVPVLSSPSNCENKTLGMNTNDDSRIELDSLSVSIHVLEENEVSSANPNPDCCSAGHEILSLDDEVVVSTDFFLYKDIYSTEACVTFSTSCIRIECPTVNGSKGSFNAEWAAGDITSIESEWWAWLETAMISLYLKPKVSKGTGNTNGTSGNDKLKFSVYDPCWSERQEAIKSLDVRYRDIWNVVFKSNMVKDDNDLAGPNITSIWKHSQYFLDETLDEVVYPKGDPDGVAFSMRDVELLQPETFINDTIIDFYVKFLKDRIQLEDNRSFHFFNSFFFRKLADLDKKPSSACEGRAAFQRVCKWTRKVNLFEKDFLFIPINYSLHWSLIVICHPGEIVNFRGKSKDNGKDLCDEVTDSTLRVPCILHMNSIRGSHRGLKNLIQSYLCEEWKERHREILDDVSSKFSCLRFIPLELPQQGNSFDCGLFLLHYLELFLEEVPSDFNPFKITQSSSFLNRNWFPPEEASLKRGRIQRLMLEILADHSQKVPQLESINTYPCSKYDDRETGVEFFEEKCSLNVCEDNSSGLNTELGIGISLPLESSPRLVHQKIKEPGLGDRDLCEQETRTRPFAYENYMRVGAGRVSFMSPIEEAVESGEQNLDSSPTSQGSCQILGYVTDSPTFSSQNYAHIEEIDDDSTSCGSATSGSQKSSEIGLDGDHSDEEFEGFVYPTESEDGQHSKETNRQDSCSASVQELTARIVEDFQEEDLTACIVEDSEEASGIENENGRSLSDGEFDRMNMIIGEDKVHMTCDNLASESDILAAKNGKADVS